MPGVYWCPGYLESMRRLPMFWQIFLVYAMLVVPALGLLGSTVVAWVEQEMLLQVEYELRNATALLQEAVRIQEPPQAQARLTRLRERLGLRITLLAADGSVLVETDH